MTAKNSSPVAKIAEAQPIVIEQVYNAALHKVWGALTDGEQMKQ
jgi:uncharacterized protein YndB with AHSA1/START domain